MFLTVASQFSQSVLRACTGAAERLPLVLQPHPPGVSYVLGVEQEAGTHL